MRVFCTRRWCHSSEQIEKSWVLAPQGVPVTWDHLGLEGESSPFLQGGVSPLLPSSTHKHYNNAIPENKRLKEIIYIPWNIKKNHISLLSQTTSANDLKPYKYVIQNGLIKIQLLYTHWSLYPAYLLVGGQERVVSLALDEPLQGHPVSVK